MSRFPSPDPASGLTAGLNRLADSPAPPSTVDVARAIGDGRRRMFTHRVSAVGGGTAFAAAAVGLGVSALSGTGGTVSANPATSGAPAKTAPAFTGTDPIVSRAQFGDLPAGMTLTGTESYNGGVEFAQAPDGPLQFELSSSDTEPTLGPIPNQPFDKVPATVAGSPRAYWAVDKDEPKDNVFSGTATLRWETADGKWGEIMASGLTGAAWKGEVLQAAAGVKIGEVRQAAFPLHVANLPAALGQAQGMVRRNQPAAAPLEAALNFDLGGVNTVLILAQPSGLPPVTATGPAAAQPGRPSGDPTTKPAPPHDRACEDSNGLNVCVTVQGTEAITALASVGGVKGLLTHITSLGTDPAKWTTAVIGS